MEGKSHIPPSRGLKAAIYCRTSREYDGVETVSLDQQEEDGRRLAKSLKAKVAHILIDENRSGRLWPAQWASDPNNPHPNGRTRPGFSKLIGLIESGEINLVIARKRNRLMRSFMIHKNFWRLCEDKGLQVAFTHEFSGKASDSSERLSMDMIALFSEHQIQQCSEDQIAAKAYSKRHGMKLGPTRLLGYEDRDGKSNKGKIFETEHLPKAVETFRRFVGGESMASISRWLQGEIGNNPQTGKPFIVNSVRRILDSPHYIGKSYNKEGKLVDSIWPKAMSQDLWQAVQDLRSKTKGVRKNGQTIHLLTGVLIDGASGDNLVAYTRTDKTVVYKHPKKGKDKAFEMLESEWERFIDWLLALEVIEESVPPSKPKGDPHKELASVRKEMQINVQALASAKASRYEYDMLMDALRASERAVLKRISEADSETAKKQSVQWFSASPEAKRMEIRRMIEAVVVRSDRVEVSTTPAYGTDMPQPLVFPLMLKREDPSVGRAKHCILPYDIPSFVWKTGREGSILTWDFSADHDHAEFTWASRPKDRKPCSRCGRVKPLTDFYKLSRASDGRYPACKACLRSEEAKKKAALRTRAWRRRSGEQSASQGEGAPTR
jgi:DNA invertase Pin-like site-specific DNA recombinase